MNPRKPDVQMTCEQCGWEDIAEGGSGVLSKCPECRAWDLVCEELPDEEEVTP